MASPSPMSIPARMPPDEHMAKVLTLDEARRIASYIAKLKGADDVVRAASSVTPLP